MIYLPYIHLGEGWAQFGSAETVRDLLISVGLLVRAGVEPCVRRRSFYQAIGGAFATITMLRMMILPSYCGSNPNRDRRWGMQMWGWLNR